MITEKQVVQYLKNKDQDYIDNLLDHIKNSCSSNDKSGSKIICPICGSSSIKKNGKDVYEKQRYFCNECHRSFSENTKTLFFCSHFTKDQWLKFIDYEISGLTLKDEAYFMNTSITTCFYMRHKLYKTASQIIQEQKLSDEIEIDSQYLSINLKGTKPENMPRYSKKRGKQSAYRGISHHKVCVACAIDSQDNIMMNIVGLGSESFEKYMSVINRLDNVKKLISDSKSCFKHELIKIFAKRYAVKLFLPNVDGKGIAIYKALAYFKAGIASLGNKRIDVPVLDATSIGISLLRKEFNTASNIMLMLKISELLEDYTRQKVTLQLGDSLMNKFDKVWIYKDEQEQEIAMSDLKQGQTVIVQTGSMVPIDGEIIDGEAMVNESSFTGEPLSKRVTLNDTVYAGTLIEDGKIFVKVRNLQDESRIAKIIDMIDTNESLKASIQSKAEHMADAIVPYSFLGFFGVWAFTRNLTRATALLLVDYSCAIRLSTSISVISAMQEASMHNVLVKGGKHLESMKDANVIVFDKTGTLTHAKPVVLDVVPLQDYTREEVLKIAACLEEHFPHSVANAIVHQAEVENLKHREEHAEVKYVIAHGISTSLNGEDVIIGSSHFVFEDEGVEMTQEIKDLISSLESKGSSSLIYLAIAKKLAGIISIYDPLKPEAKEVVQELRDIGFDKVIMLTGDSPNCAKAIAKQLNLDDFRAEVLPEDKASYIESLKKEGNTVVMVGDGINDTPALSMADVSISLQDSSDIARELADITLVSNSLNDIVALRMISEGLFKRIHSQYRLIVGLNTSFIVLGALGLLTPQMLAMLHNGSTFLIASGSTRSLLH